MRRVSTRGALFFWARIAMRGWNVLDGWLFHVPKLLCCAWLRLRRRELFCVWGSLRPWSRMRRRRLARRRLRLRHVVPSRNPC